MAITPANEDDDIEVPPESGIVAPLQEAAAELALAERGVRRSIERMLHGLTPKERAIVERRFAKPEKGRPR